jgi:hypothetical protein
MALPVRKRTREANWPGPSIWMPPFSFVPLLVEITIAGAIILLASGEEFAGRRNGKSATAACLDNLGVAWLNSFRRGGRCLCRKASHLHPYFAMRIS